MSQDDSLNDKIVDTVADYGQRAIELVSSSDLVKEIPLLKTVAFAGAAIQCIRDEMLISKIGAFLAPLADVTTEERQSMVERLQADSKYRRRVGENLVELLDRTESYRKPKIFGEIFAALARGQIDVGMLQRLISATERLPTMEIENVRRFVESKLNAADRAKIDMESIYALINSGLAQSHVAAPIGGTVTTYFATKTGETFVELMLDHKSSAED